MLILQRKEGETILFTLPTGHQIELMVLQIRKRSVKLAIRAPADVGIWRGEIFKHPTKSRGVAGPEAWN